MDNPSLAPSQSAALADLRAGQLTSPVAAFFCHSGLGRTTVLRALHRELGGAFLTIKAPSCNFHRPTIRPSEEVLKTLPRDRNWNLPSPRTTMDCERFAWNCRIRKCIRPTSRYLRKWLWH